MIFEKCCDMRLCLSPTNDLSFDNGGSPSSKKRDETCSVLDRIFLLFPAHAIGLSRCRATDGGILLLTKLIISGWWAGCHPMIRFRILKCHFVISAATELWQCFFLLSLIGLLNRSCPILWGIVFLPRPLLA